MKQQNKALSIFTCLFILLPLLPGYVTADITGNTYWFSATWLNQTYQENLGEEFKSSVSGEFKITVLNAIEAGGDDVYEYNFQGFSWYRVPYYLNVTSDVEFQENKVSFEIETEDEDEDNRAETAELALFPSFQHHHPGHMFFVNPIWSTHNTGWESAVNEAQNDNTTAELTESSGEGSFSLRLVIDIESDSEDEGQLNGTRTFDFTASYDSDGILTNWESTATTRLSNENHTSRHILTEKYSRTTGPSGGFGIGGDTATALGFIGVAAVAGIVVGVILGKRY
ncbi:hypothetical protein EU537_04020 [Candidatus Thorarchaeota archaeon]|nr:MAG: hypothetical protein EU537_04020 [Candidatus Thorarchaeota archaeon]